MQQALSEYNRQPTHVWTTYPRQYHDRPLTNQRSLLGPLGPCASAGREEADVDEESTADVGRLVLLPSSPRTKASTGSLLLDYQPAGSWPPSINLLRPLLPLLTSSSSLATFVRLVLPDHKWTCRTTGPSLIVSSLPRRRGRSTRRESDGVRQRRNSPQTSSRTRPSPFRSRHQHRHQQSSRRPTQYECGGSDAGPGGTGQSSAAVGRDFVSGMCTLEMLLERTTKFGQAVRHLGCHQGSY